MNENKSKKSLNERLDVYIQKCIDGAIDGARKMVPVVDSAISCHPEFWYTIIGNDLIFDCQKVYGGPQCRFDEAFFRRLVYRLFNNIPKNFGLAFHAPRLVYASIECDSMRYEICDDYDFDWHHAITQIKIFGETKIICGHLPVRPYELQTEEELEHYLDWFAKAHFDWHNPYSFASYYACYTEVFKEEPIETWVRVNEQRKLYMPTEEIEKQAFLAYQKMGCTYANVCGLYKASVCKGNGCLRADSVKCKDGIAMSRYRMIRQKHFDEQYLKYLNG